MGISVETFCTFSQCWRITYVLGFLVMAPKSSRWLTSACVYSYKRSLVDVSRCLIFINPHTTPLESRLKANKTYILLHGNYWNGIYANYWWCCWACLRFSGNVKFALQTKFHLRNQSSIKSSQGFQEAIDVVRKLVYHFLQLFRCI